MRNPRFRGTPPIGDPPHPIMGGPGNWALKRGSGGPKKGVKNDLGYPKDGGSGSFLDPFLGPRDPKTRKTPNPDPIGKTRCQEPENGCSIGKIEP